MWFLKFDAALDLKVTRTARCHPGLAPSASPSLQGLSLETSKTLDLAVVRSFHLIGEPFACCY